MKVGEFMGGGFLKASDVPQPIKVTFASFEKREVGDDRKEKLVAYFKEIRAGLVLNSTNLQILVDWSKTDESDHWIGKQVMLYNDENVFMGSKRTGGIRIRTPKAKPTLQTEPEPVDHDFADVEFDPLEFDQ